MPIRDPAARRKSIRNDYGTDAAADAPTSHTVHLFIDDEDGTGTEITGDGYGPGGPILPADWVDDEAEGIYAMVTFPAPTGPWEEATDYRLKGSDGLWWDGGALAEPLLVTGAGDAPVVRVPLFYGDTLTDMEA